MLSSLLFNRIRLEMHYQKQQQQQQATQITEIDSEEYPKRCQSLEDHCTIGEYLGSLI